MAKRHWPLLASTGLARQEVDPNSAVASASSRHGAKQATWAWLDRRARADCPRPRGPDGAATSVSLEALARGLLHLARDRALALLDMLRRPRSQLNPSRSWLSIALVIGWLLPSGSLARASGSLPRPVRRASTPGPQLPSKPPGRPVALADAQRARAAGHRRLYPDPRESGDRWWTGSAGPAHAGVGPISRARRAVRQQSGGEHHCDPRSPPTPVGVGRVGSPRLFRSLMLSRTVPSAGRGSGAGWRGPPPTTAPLRGARLGPSRDGGVGCRSAAARTSSVTSAITSAAQPAVVHVQDHEALGDLEGPRCRGAGR